jgi:ketosteroid isomerase-like protein
MTRRIAAVALLALAACAPKPETPEQMTARIKAESDSAKTALQAGLDRSCRYLAAGRADSLAMFYAEDAVLMMPNEPAVKGRTAIQAEFAKYLSYGTYQCTLTTTGVEANGPLAVQWYAYVETFKPGPHAPPGMAAMFPDTGYSVTAYRKVNGQWLAFADIGVSSRAMPAPAAKKH